MFIATGIMNQFKLRRSETKGPTRIALLRSCKSNEAGFYKHLIPTRFIGPRNLLKKQEVRAQKMRYPEKPAHLLAIILLALAPLLANGQTRFAGTRGKEIVAPNGKPLLLKGINLGNWLLPEGYM